MTQVKTEPDIVLCNFLRANLTDINASRSGEWIWPDFPRTQDLGNTSFPRVGITILSESSDSLGIYDDNQWETITFQIDVVNKKGQIYNVTTTDKAIGTVASTSNSNRMSYEYAPNSVTNIQHNTVAFGTVTNVATDTLFTTPAAGTVEWSTSTGNLNFASADLTSYAGQSITSTSIINLEGKKACQYIAREIVKALRNNWRTSDDINGLLYPIKISNNPIPFEEIFGIFRQTLEYQFRAFNAGEGI